MTKVTSLNTSSIGSLVSTKKALRHEVEMCNHYWMKENGSSPATLRENRITMPFIEGTSPDKSDTCKAVKDLYEKGLMMGDPCPSNFIKTRDGRIVPVDFGLVFARDNLEDIDKQVKMEIVRDYIKGGHRYIPAELRPQYTAGLQELDSSLGHGSPARKMNVKDLARAGLLGSFV